MFDGAFLPCHFSVLNFCSCTKSVYVKNRRTQLKILNICTIFGPIAWLTFTGLVGKQKYVIRNSFCWSLLAVKQCKWCWSLLKSWHNARSVVIGRKELQSRRNFEGQNGSMDNKCIFKCFLGCIFRLVLFSSVCSLIFVSAVVASIPALNDFWSFQDPERSWLLLS